MMQQELLIALFAGLGGMLGWGFADFFAKKTIDKIGPIASLVWAHLFGTLVLVGVALYTYLVLGKQMTFPGDLEVWGGLLFFGTLQMIVYWLAYQGFGKGQIAVLNPVFASFTGLVAFISIVVFGEDASAHRLLALFVIFAGVILISLDIKGLRSKNLTFVPGLKEVGAATILAAIWTLGWDKFVGSRDWLVYALFMYVFMTLAAFVIAKLLRVRLSGVKSNLWIFLAGIGLGETVAYAAISLGYASTSLTSVVALISGAFSLPTIILAYIFLKERVTAIQTAGTLVVVAGIIILSIIR